MGEEDHLFILSIIQSPFHSLFNNLICLPVSKSSFITYPEPQLDSPQRGDFGWISMVTVDKATYKYFSCILIETRFWLCHGDLE